jgi:flagella basal body P-ring formation protein FlgA
MKHTKRVKTKLLIRILYELGYKDIHSKHSYTQFTQKSPIHTQNIKYFLRLKYEEVYPNIIIQDIKVVPRSYLSSLKDGYSITVNRKFYLKNRGTLFIKTDENKKIFFDYKIKAKLTLLQAKTELQRGDELSNINIRKTTIQFNKFRAMPLLQLKKASYEAKRRIKKGTTLTSRDVAGLMLVKRGDSVSVTILDQNIAISFIGKAKKSGRYGQTITVVNSNGKRINAIVTGRKIAEIR